VADVEFSVAGPPSGGLWRVARADEPLRPSWLEPGDADLPSGGNRFDSSDWGTLYFATNLEGCFAETLARFRPSAHLFAVLKGDDDWQRRGFMEPGSVPADWRHRRVAVRVELHRESRFLDVEVAESHVVLTQELAEELDDLGYEALDVAIVRGGDRRVTRAIAEWAYLAVDFDSDEPVFGGVRYVSRIGDWECWSIFDRTPLAELERRSITLKMSELVRIGARFGLRLY
jgi:hypothetical protein